eukprot:32725-Chlamydomonas_euryale.AAC.22
MCATLGNAGCPAFPKAPPAFSAAGQSASLYVSPHARTPRVRRTGRHQTTLLQGIHASCQLR